MIVRKVDSQVFQRPRREALAGKGLHEGLADKGKDFEQYLIEAFQGKIVKKDKHFSKDLSNQTRENLIRLSAT